MTLIELFDKQADGDPVREMYAHIVPVVQRRIWRRGGVFHK
jgi:hypothetical protein